MKTLDKVVFIQNGSYFLYFFPTTGKNAYNSMTLNLALKKEDKIRGGNGATKARDFIPNIIKCEWKQQFLNCWLSFQNLNNYLKSKGYEIVNYADEFNSLDDFFLFMVKERSKEIGLNGFLKADEIVKLTKKISELKADYTAKKARLTSLESSLAKVLMQINKLESTNSELLESENFDDKKFSANSLKIATLKRDNRELLNNRNSLYSICENLESEIATLETELNELKSV